MARHTFSCRKWYHDPALVEHLSSDTFWALGVFLLFAGYWMFRAPKPTTSGDNSGQDIREPVNGDGPSSDCHSQPDSSAKTTLADESLLCTKLRPYILTRSRQIFAIGAAALLVPLYLLEGFWVLKTAWRITAAAVPATYPRIRPRILGFILYSPITAVILASWAVILTLGLFLLAANILFLHDLRNLRPGLNLQQETSSTSSTQSSDGDWSRIEAEKSKDE